jgi:hypothetical protein
MKLRLKILCCILLCFACAAASAQSKNSKTVYITRIDPEDKTPAEQIWFRHLSLSIPLRANPYRDFEYDTDGTQLGNLLIPNGISAHLGYGIHYRSKIGLSLNTGIDYTGYLRLVNVPVYGSLMLNPHISDESSIIIQGGYGYSFALGRGSLSGTYQKYRLGLGFDDSIVIYLEVNASNFSVHGYNTAANFCVGFMALDFL